MKEVGDIVGRSLGLLTAVAPFLPGADVIGAILGAGTMAFDSYMAPSGSEASAWASAKLQENLQTMQDYLVCEMKEVIGDYFAEYMGSESLDNYNNALAAIQSDYFTKCGKRNCLNYTDLAANNRGDCCDTSPDLLGLEQCKEASEENISHAQACNTRSGLLTGVCGQDRQCYKCVDADEVIQDVKDTIHQFFTGDYLSAGESLNGYQNVDAITAYAKGAGFALQLYQYLILLGERSANSASVAFANNTRGWLQKKINAMQSNSSRLNVVDGSSEFYDAVWGDAERKCGTGEGGCHYHKVQSLTQAPGYRVRFGCGDGRQHYFVRLASDDKDFCNGCANDEVTMSTFDASRCEVTFYDDADYKGSSQTWPAEASWLDKMNDKISSFKVSSGCPGLTLYEDVNYNGGSEYLRKEEYVGDVDWVGEQMNDKASSYRPWVTAELYNKTNGCTCTALQQSANILNFRPYWTRDEFEPVNWKCARTIYDYADDGDEKPSKTTRFCNAWTRDSTGFSGYSRTVPSFNSKRLEAAERLRDLYDEKLADVYSFINNLTMYIENGGASNWTWGVLRSEYYPRSPECPSLENVGINR